MNYHFVDLATLIAKFAPTIGSVLPIPGGEFIGQIVASLFDGTILDIPELINKIQSDPDAKNKLQNLELEHKDNLHQVLVTHAIKASDPLNLFQYVDQLQNISVNISIGIPQINFKKC